MAPLAETPSLELGHYLDVLRRRAWLIGLFVLVTLLAGVVYLATATREVTATTAVNLNVISSDPFSQQRSPADMIDAATELQLVQSSAVLRKAADALGDQLTLSEIRRRTQANLVSGATVMKVSYRADSVAQAEDGANAVAEAYLEFRSEQAQARVTAIVDQLQDRQDALREDLVRINTVLRRAPAGSARSLQAESDRQLVNIEVDSLSSQINTFLGLDSTGGTVLTSAAESPTQISPSRAVVLATAVVLGLILGVLAAFLANAFDRRIRDEYDVRKAGGGRILGTLVERRPSVPAAGADLDTIRSVRELMFAQLPPDDPPAVVVADLTSSESALDVAVNLAHAVGDTGRPVTLVMPDAASGEVHRVAKALDLAPATPNGHYSQRFVSDGFTLAVPLRASQLDLGASGNGSAGGDVAAGGAPGGARGNGSRAQGAGLQEMTVVAVPTGARHSSLLAAGRLGHAVVLVVSKGGTTRKAVAQATEELPELGAKIYGTVLVPRRRKRAHQ